jgi:hypothetical protein
VSSEIASLNADFQRAVERGNVTRAESAARQLGKLSLENALRLLFLYAEKEPAKYERAALRWLGRYATEGKAVSLLKAQLALAALAELRTSDPDLDVPVHVPRDAPRELATDVLRLYQLLS